MAVVHDQVGRLVEAAEGALMEMEKREEKRVRSRSRRHSVGRPSLLSPFFFTHHHVAAVVGDDRDSACEE